MAKHWIRGLFALLMTITVVGGIVYVAKYAIDRQAEISRLEIESYERQYLACIEAESIITVVNCCEPTTEKLEPTPDPMSSKSSSSVLRRLPDVEDYGEPTVVRPREGYLDTSPWPGNQATPQRDPYTESLERRLMPPELKPNPETVPKPYRPGSTDPNRREEFRQREKPVIRMPGKVAMAL